MSESQFADVDMVKELRLRRWARENYVAPHERQSSWHPIVLDEMRTKDDEMPEWLPASFPYVPLVPSTTHTFHASHVHRLEPNLIRKTDEAEVYFHG